MSTAVKAEEGKSYDGYDNLAAIEWCTPSFLGCQVCASATAVKGKVTLTLNLKSPFGNASKSFVFSGNINFTWQPISRIKVTISVANLNENPASVSFDLGLKPCIDVPIVGWKCFNFNAQISVPTSVQGFESELDNNQFSSLLALHANDNSAAGMLQGDLYNNYLNNQNVGAGFPTWPISSCIPPIPTVPVVSCVTCTGVSPICSGQQTNASNLQGGFPTWPISSCIPPIPTVPVVSCVTCTGVSPICSGQQGGAVQGNAAHLQGGFPTWPISSCIPPIPTVPVVSCVTCTGISPVCSAQGNAEQSNAANLQAGFPTWPISSCIPPIPTVPVVSCVTCTGVSPICSAQNNNAAGNQGAFPTLIACMPTLPPVCFPTLNVSCHTLPSICKTQSNTLQGSIPTMPVLQCVPTGQCVPTIQCIPTVQCVPTIAQCTGIPFVC